jgi:outer membrane protein
MIQKEIYRGEINTLIANIESAYWDLALAESDLQIKTRSRDRAKQQFEDTAENIRRGIIADVEIYIVEENVVIFEQELLRTDQTLATARRRLAELLALEPDELLDAEDELVKPTLTAPSRQATVKLGLEQSPAILAQLRRSELASARYGYASNQALPALNLNAGVAVFRYAIPEATVGLSLSVPLDRGAISSAVESSRIDNEKQEVELRNQQSKVQFEIENALAELELNLRLLSFATKRVELAELKLGAQNDKYKNGISTLADVVRFQRDLDDALIASQRLIRAVHVGQSKLLSSQGTLAKTVGVGLE